MPYPSPYPPVAIPDVDIFTFLFNNPEKQFPDNHTAFIDGNTKRKNTHEEVRESAKRFGTGIKSMWDWRKGDVLLIFSTNNIDTPAITFGTLWAGGVVTPANPAYTVEELTFQLRDSGAKAICTIPALYPVAKAAAQNVGIEADRIIFLGDKPAAGWPDKRYSWRDIFDQTTTVKWRKPKINPSKELAFLVYSSGTTGIPKGVMISHTNIVANVSQIVNVETKREMHWSRDKIIAFLPFFHIYGLTCMMIQGFYSGLPMVVMDKFDLPKFCSLVQDEKVTYVYAVPPVVLLLAKHPVVANYDLKSVRMINSGAAPLTKELVDAVDSRLGLRIKQGYGLSESSPTSHMQEWADWKTKIGTVGKLLPNMVIKYVAEDGTELPAGETGEIWMKGPNVMMGYLNNPEATKNTITEDGYLKTGDVGHCDADGCLYITDRAKELIKYKGFQVPPAELEGILASHPKIDDVAVTGVYDADLASEVPRAYVVLAKDVPATPETVAEIHAFMDSKVAHHKRLRGGIKFIDAIPKSASGKILRRILKAQIKEEAEKAIKAKL